MKAKVRYTVENGRSGSLKIGSGRVPMRGAGTFELSPAQLVELRNTAGVTLTKYTDPKPKSTTTTSGNASDIVLTNTDLADALIMATATSGGPNHPRRTGTRKENS